jgi:hypothetical protein
MNPLRYHVVLADGYAPLSNAAEDHGGQLPAKPAHPHGSVFSNRSTHRFAVSSRGAGQRGRLK